MTTRSTVVFLGLLLAVSRPPANGEPPVIPRPSAIQTTRMPPFELSAAVRVQADGASRDAGELVNSMLRVLFADERSVVPIDRDAGDPAIVLIADDGIEHDEGYAIDVGPRRIEIRAGGDAGRFYGVQTLRQLLPARLERGQPLAVGDTWLIPSGSIRDEPRFAWRGVMLDPARHFLPKSFILETIEVMAMHKLNRLHLHLVDDQGWRIEIDGYPMLTRVGAWREASPEGTGYPTGPAHGGFYTKDDLREIIEHAAAHHIEIIPEIELPGHAGAALAAYPLLGCTQEAMPVSTHWGVHRDVFCAGRESTFEFFEAVLDEVCDLFPGEYVHIGGDECPKAQWRACDHCQRRIRDEGLADEDELQSFTIRRAEAILHARGKRLIGWDEILEGGLAPDATVMSWRGVAGAIEAARHGHDTVVCPTSHCYIDFAQAPVGEPKAIHGNQAVTTLERVYSFEPIPAELTDAQRRHVLGTQVNLWGEYVPGTDHARYMLYPRVCAISEVAWSAPSRRDFGSFQGRLPALLARFDAMGIGYRDPRASPAMVGGWTPDTVGESWADLEWDLTGRLDRSGTHALAFRYTSGAHRLDIERASLVVGGRVVAVDAHNGQTGGSTHANVYHLTLRDPPAGGRVVLRARVRADGGADSHGELWLMRIDE